LVLMDQRFFFALFNEFQVKFVFSCAKLYLIFQVQ